MSDLRTTLWDEDDTIDLAEEFRENGLYEAAEYLAENGVKATLTWIENEAMPRAIEEDRLWHHGEGFELHNLQVARDRLNGV